MGFLFSCSFMNVWFYYSLNLALLPLNLPPPHPLLPWSLHLVEKGA